MKKWLAIVLICGLAAISGIATGVRAQGDDPKEEPAADKAPDAAEPAPTAAPAAAPVLPPYFTGTNTDPANPSWPDPTGGKAGYWTTPAAGPVGDGDPAAQTPAGLYERITHNLFSINIVWTMVTGFLVMFMQAGFMMVETGL